VRRLVVVAALLLAVPSGAAAKLPLRTCYLGGATGLCGRVVVPENRALDGGRTISLRVMVLRAWAPDPLPDPVFFLAGGPGGAATQWASAMRTAYAPVNERHDVVLVDQRGTGGSHALACPKPKAPLTSVAAGRRYVRACLAHLDGDATQYGTLAAMDDLDRVRRALGYGKIDLFGASYGATAAQAYIRRHPGSVRSVVLDGGTLVTVPIFERLGSNGRRALDIVARECAAEARCARAYPTWRRDVPRLLARLARRPATVAVPGYGKVTLAEADAAGTIQSMTLAPDDAGRLPLLVAQAMHGVYAPLARAAVRPSPMSAPPTAVMPYSVMCNEPWAVRDPARAAADARGTYLAAAAKAWASQQSAVCSVFPKRHDRPADWRPPRSKAPLLAIVGEADPQDPLANIAGIRRTMPNSRFVVVRAGLHTNSQFGCVPELIARFVDRGGARGLDVSCARSATRPNFAYR